jgi:hypothetical protein
MVTARHQDHNRAKRAHRSRWALCLLSMRRWADARAFLTLSRLPTSVVHFPQTPAVRVRRIPPASHRTHPEAQSESQGDSRLWLVRPPPHACSPGKSWGGDYCVAADSPIIFWRADCSERRMSALSVKVVLYGPYSVATSTARNSSAVNSTETCASSPVTGVHAHRIATRTNNIVLRMVSSFPGGEPLVKEFTNEHGTI